MFDKYFSKAWKEPMFKHSTRSLDLSGNDISFPVKETGSSHWPARLGPQELFKYP
jgi:hypothetical protein